MNFRSAVPGDIPLMLALERAAPTAAHWAEEQYQHIFSHPKLGRYALVAEESERVLGFAVIRGAGPEWELENIVVAAEAQRRGLGQALLGAALRLARDGGAEAIFLEVRESNTPARRLYQRAGFVEAGRRQAYYRDPVEDALVLRLRF